MVSMSAGGILGRVRRPSLPLPTNLQDVGRIMKICKIEYCENKHYAKGYCKKHYMRLRRHGDPLHESREYHGMRRSSEYETWINMKARCYNQNNHAYQRYGGRGIIVCDRWRDSFMAFYEDLGPKPFPKAQIDRKNNNGNYMPKNCRWVTAAENSRNGSRTKLTMEKARAIRKAYKAGGVLQRELAWLYGVVETVISDIISQKRWSE